MSRETIEDEITREAIVNGATQTWDKIVGYLPAAFVARCVAAAVRRALDLGIIPEDVKRHTQAFTDQEDEKEAARLAALREEKAKLIHELEELGEGAEGVAEGV